MRIKIMKKIFAIVLILALALPVCAKKHKSDEIITPQTQLEKRKFQTRTYKAKDQTAVLKSILNVLQDEGYIVYNVNSLLGFIYAVKDFDTTDPNVDISKEFGLSKSRLSYNGVKVATLETSANVTQYGENIRVRINFKRKLLNEYGNAQFIDDVSEADFYDAFYAKLDNALSLHKELNAPKIVPANNTETKIQKTNSEKEVVLTPDLLKEINDNIEKIIKSDSVEIPALSDSEKQTIKKEEAKADEINPIKDNNPEALSKPKELVEDKNNQIKEKKQKEEIKKDEPKNEKIKNEETKKEEVSTEEKKIEEKKQDVEDSNNQKQDKQGKKSKKADKNTEKE